MERLLLGAWLGVTRATLKTVRWHFVLMAIRRCNSWESQNSKQQSPHNVL